MRKPTAPQPLFDAVAEAESDKPKPRYYVETYDYELGRMTPQKGVRKGPYTLFGLRKAINALRDMGYPCDYSSHEMSGDPSVSIYRVD